MKNFVPEKQKRYFTYISIKLIILIWLFSLLWHSLVILLCSVVDVVVIKRDPWKPEEYQITLIPSTSAANAKNEGEEEVSPPVEESSTAPRQEEQESESLPVAGIGEKSTEAPSEERKNEEQQKAEDDSREREERPKTTKIVLPWTQDQQKTPLGSTEATQLAAGDGNSAYGMRSSEQRKQALHQYGGNAASENSVIRGLKWLMRHQDPDGKWSGIDFQKHCKDKSCWGRGFRKHTSGLTGLVYLAFLASGHTPKSNTEYSQNLAKTQKYLLRLQNSEGYFDSKDMYNHAIVLLAITESYALTGDISIAPVIRKAITASINAQQPGGGWTYEAHSTVSRSDSSITGWMVLALTSAKRAGFHVPPRIFSRVWRHFKRMRTLSGEVRYADTGTSARRTSNALAAVRLLTGLLIGEKDLSMAQQLEIVANCPPRWDQRKSIDNCMYYWYHGTLAMFLQGGKYWQAWNANMRDMLIRHQVLSGEARGSWPPSTKWGSAGGRIYSTALNVLNLEIYYRYQPTFMKR